MRTVNFTFSICGDSKDELVEKAEIEIAKFLGMYVDEYDLDFEEPLEPLKVNYEMIVEPEEDGKKYDYRAQVIVRFKDA